MSKFKVQMKSKVQTAKEILGIYSFVIALTFELFQCLASRNRREDAQDIPFFQYLFFFPVNPVDQNDLRDLFGYFESG